MRRLFLLALLAAVLISSGCLSREFSSCAEEVSVQADMMVGDPWVDLTYFTWVNTNTTRTEDDAWQINEDMNEVWQELADELRPQAPVALPAPTLEPPAKFDWPSKTPVVAPPKKTVVEKIEEGEIVIIRRPDGTITVTNKSEKVEK